MAFYGVPPSERGAAAGPAGDPGDVPARAPAPHAEPPLHVQLAQLSTENTALHRDRSHNAQRLVDLSERLHACEETLRTVTADRARAKEEAAALATQASDLRSAIAEKNRNIEVGLRHAHTAHRQMIHDELATQSLELYQMDARNRELQADNASLLDRWLRHKSELASRMNEEAEHGAIRPRTQDTSGAARRRDA